MNSNDEKKTPPIDYARSGDVEIPIWVNVSKKNGKRYAAPGETKMQIRNKDGEYEDVEKPYASHLLDLADAAREAHRIIENWKKAQQVIKHGLDKAA